MLKRNIGYEGSVRARGMLRGHTLLSLPKECFAGTPFRALSARGVLCAGVGAGSIIVVLVRLQLLCLGGVRGDEGCRLGGQLH